MTQRYRREISRLAVVYEAARDFDVWELSKLVASFGTSPLTVIGSGGSFSSASFAALIHEYYTSNVARAVTPLEHLGSPNTRSGVLCLSACGRNKDIGLAFRAACQNEAGVVGAFVMSNDTPLHALQKRFEYARVVSVEHKSLRDGFLAVATLVASCTMLIKAYELVFGGSLDLPSGLNELAERCLVGTTFQGIRDDAIGVTDRETTCLLYAPVAKPAAVDLESRFVEAALGNLHASDFRNFGHGRHNWLAKRADRTGIVSMVSDQLAHLSDRTHKLIPRDIPLYTVHLEGPFQLQALSAVLAGLYISAAAGLNAGVDPGKPGVPHFGRSLYRLSPGIQKSSQAELNKWVAIRRKSPSTDLVTKDRCLAWERAYAVAVKRFKAARFGAIVVDYDGTLCELENRYEPLQPEVGAALERLLENGCAIGMATGRGPSAGKELRKVISSKFWPDFKIGYYNGGIITSLDDDRDPIVGDTTDDPLYQAISNSELFRQCKIRHNDVQTSIRLGSGIDVIAAAAAVQDMSDQTQLSVKITTSGHSLDIVRSSSTKASVVDVIAKRLQPASLEVLRIGDKGAWPGNDAGFLDSPFGLSVDTVSSHKMNCWNLAPAGIRGTQATLYYFHVFSLDSDSFKLMIRPGDTGIRRAP